MAEYDQNLRGLRELVGQLKKDKQQRQPPGGLFARQVPKGEDVFKKQLFEKGAHSQQEGSGYASQHSFISSITRKFQ